jgi:hypothetical protein
MLVGFATYTDYDVGDGSELPKAPHCMRKNGNAASRHDATVAEHAAFIFLLDQWPAPDSIASAQDQRPIELDHPDAKAQTTCNHQPLTH